MQYRVLLHKSEVGYTAVSTHFPVCYSLGATAEEALENVREVLPDLLTGRVALRWREAPRSDAIRTVEVEVDLQQEAVMEYPIRLLKHREGYAVSYSMSPGCVSQGQTVEEALAYPERHPRVANIRSGDTPAGRAGRCNYRD